MIYPKYLAPGVSIVGRFEPVRAAHELDPYYIIDEIKLQVKDFIDIGINYSVRAPELNLAIKDNPQANSWHRDLNFSADAPMAMVVWSNREQTEIRLSDGTIIQPEPNDILLIHNDKVVHRTPQTMSKDRWFYRAHVPTIPDWL